MNLLVKSIWSYIHDLHHWIHLNIGLYPKIYYLIYARKYPANYIATNSATNICIEGFPRCANTYAVAAFKLSNKNVKVSHHLHVPAQIFKSISMQIPTIVVIRKPQEAITSLLVLKNSINADIYLKSYIKYYKSIISLLYSVVVADFTSVIGDFNNVIRAVNKKYGTNYKIIDNLKQRQNEIFKQLEELNKQFQEGNKNLKTYPDKTKEIHNQKVKEYTKRSKFLAEANEIYERIIEISV